MSSKKVISFPQKPEATTANTAAKASAMPFGKTNYTVTLIGIALILLGFFIMSQDKEEFGFGFLGLTLGPIVVMIGFIVEFWAILRKK
jgi:isoprenylcysteine carboxyl methyltransferase (ICMT) family protein YpbQ